jgi:hypothetical protein
VLKRADYLIILAMLGVAFSMISPLLFFHFDPESLYKSGIDPHAFIFLVIFLPLLIAFVLVIYMEIRLLKEDFKYRMRGT